MPADKWIETYRGTVFRWEVDDNDHFTVAYYLARIADASVAMLHALGTGPAPTVDCFIRYQHELRVGDIMHIDSAVIAVDADGRRARPQAVRVRRRRSCAPPSSSASRVRLDPQTRRTIEARRVAWDGPARDVRPRPSTSRRLPRQLARHGEAVGDRPHRTAVAVGGRASLLGLERPRPRRLRRHAGVHASIAPWLLDLRVPAGSGQARSRPAIPWSCAARWFTSATLRCASFTPCSTSATAWRWRAWSSRACTSTRTGGARPPLPDELRTRALALLVRPS